MCLLKRDSDIDLLNCAQLDQMINTRIVSSSNAKVTINSDFNKVMNLV